MKRRILGIGLVVVWGSALAFGMHAAMSYDAAPGTPARPQPAKQATSGKWSCTMIVHPYCPCSQASLKALREVAERYPDELSLDIVFAWQGGPAPCDNLELAGRVPGAAVTWISPEQAEQEFGSYTSGQVLVYSPEGKLAFSGGITPGRGVDQPRYARDLFELILSGKRSESSVYGCPLQEEGA